MSYAHRVDGKDRIELKEIDAGADPDVVREEAELKTTELLAELVELQELLYAASKQSVLIVLQGMDTSGKDGTIRSITGPLNSMGCDVSSFKAPTEHELA